MRANWHDMTFEELASAIYDNLSGEADGCGESGFTEIDHSIPSHPVVRFRSDRLPKGGGTGAGGGGCFAIDGEGNFINTYYRVGDRLFIASASGNVEAYKGKCVALVVTLGSTPAAHLAGYASPAAMIAASADPDYAVLPLYQFDGDGSILCDFRNMPTSQAIEVL